MTTESNSTKQGNQKMQVKYQGGASDTVYAIGIIGAWVYYFKHVTTFREGVLAFFKGMFWPAFLVYDLLEFLHKE